MMGTDDHKRPSGAFANLYIAVREKEGRVFSEEDVRRLPDLDQSHTHYKEWQLRKKSAIRFIHYLESMRRPLHILDVGCGNGWFTHLMSSVEGSTVIGFDVNLVELEQAASVFKKPNLSFLYADLKKGGIFDTRFDAITFNSSFQYFENPSEILETVAKLLADGGEIHIIDSPFYKRRNIVKAQKRTLEYYSSLGFPQMAAHYFHHKLKDLGQYEIRYRPSWLRKDSPFYWLTVKKA
jgi:ubiquinone/menaquinone biosynthesis C-methylase UbiE